MQVVEREHDRAVAREQVEQVAHRAVRAVAVVGEHAAGRVRPAHGRQDLGEVVGGGQLELLRGDVRVQRVGPHAERLAALELGGRAREHEVAASLAAIAQLVQQARLADAGLALDRDRAGRAGVQRVERGVELLELRLAPHDRTGLSGHLAREITSVQGVGGFRVRPRCSRVAGRRGCRACRANQPKGPTCIRHATSQPALDAGALSTARPPSSAGSPS